MPTKAQQERSRQLHGDIPRPDAEYLRRILDYDKETGVFTWRVDKGYSVKAGSVAGSKSAKKGTKTYWEIGIDSRQYFAHRLAHLHVTGEWPQSLVDHEDGDGLNNAWSNLRPASQATNQHNRKSAQKGSTTGVMGVVALASGKFVAKIKVNMRRIYLGTFATVEEAGAAYLAAKREMHTGNLL